MKIKPNVPIAHLMGCYLPGQEYEVDDREAALMIDAGQASAVDPSYKPNRKTEPVKMDKLPSVPVEKVQDVKPAAAETADDSAAPATVTAVTQAKKGGK